MLDIPRIGLDQIVVQGTSAADLMNGPGLMPGSALPGSLGNSVIAGRRVTFGVLFGPIGALLVGTRITVVDGAGRFTYRVTHVLHVPIGHKDVVLPTVDNRLILVTSDSTLVTGGREVVQARLVGHAVEVPDDTIAVPSYELGLSGDPAAGGLAAMWSFLTLVVLVGAGFLAWRLRRPWLVYLFAAPMAVMCGLFACEPARRPPPPSDRPVGGARRRPSPSTVTLLTRDDVPVRRASVRRPGVPRGHRPTPSGLSRRVHPLPTLTGDVRITSPPYSPL